MKEVTKEQFKEVYFRLGGGASGWGLDYWNKFFEHDESGRKYLVEEPKTPQHTEMMIVTDGDAHEYRLFFMTDESMEAFFDFPGKDQEDGGVVPPPTLP